MKLSLVISGSLAEVDALVKAVKTHVETPGSNGRDVRIQVDIPEQEAEFEGRALSTPVLLNHRRYELYNGLGKSAGEELEPSEPADSADQVSVEDLFYDYHFGVRTFNCLARAGVNTLADLQAKSELDLQAIPNLGEKSIREIKEMLADKGLELRSEPADSAEPADGLDEILLEELNLNVRAYGCLKRFGIQTVGDLASKTEAEVRDIPNVGEKAMANIKVALAKVSLELRPEQS